LNSFVIYIARTLTAVVYSIPTINSNESWVFVHHTHNGRGISHLFFELR